MLLFACDLYWSPSRNGCEITHLKCFNLIAGSDYWPSTHILFCLIRNNCIEPTCTISCIGHLSGSWCFERTNNGK